MESVEMAAVGALASFPLAALRWWSWSGMAAKVLPALDDVHASQLQHQVPWATQMSFQQVLVMMVLEVVPVTLLLFPAAQGGIATALEMYSQVGVARHAACLTSYLWGSWGVGRCQLVCWNMYCTC